MTNEEPTTAEALLADPDFRAWVRGERPDLEAYWATWLGQHPADALQVEQARSWVLGLSVQHVSLSETERQAAIGQIMEAVREPVGRSLWYPWRWVAAAGIAGLLCWGGYRYKPPGQLPVSSVAVTPVPSREPPDLLVVATTGTVATRFIQLADGSAIFLRKGSTLHYPPRFTGTRRDVYLDGEAFFEVAKDPAHPFFVHANGVTARVLGTSFRVQSGRETVTVVVRTGRVSVLPEARSPGQSTPKPLILTVNQQATYARTNETLTRSAADPAVQRTYPALLARQFDETPVTEVLDALQRTYGIPITYNREALRHCTLTAEFGDEPLSSKMRLICKAIEATYTTTDAGIQITGSGCQ